MTARIDERDDGVMGASEFPCQSFQCDHGNNGAMVRECHSLEGGQTDANPGEQAGTDPDSKNIDFLYLNVDAVQDERNGGNEGGG